MALQFLFYAGQGPLQYEDTNTYIDMALMEASRAPQHYVESEPTQFYHVVRLSGLTSKLASVIAAGGVDSTARSMAASAATIANNAHGDAAQAALVADMAYWSAVNAYGAADAAMSYAIYVESLIP